MAWKRSGVRIPYAPPDRQNRRSERIQGCEIGVKTTQKPPKIMGVFVARRAAVEATSTSFKAEGKPGLVQLPTENFDAGSGRGDGQFRGSGLHNMFDILNVLIPRGEWFEKPIRLLKTQNQHFCPLSRILTEAVKTRIASLTTRHRHHQRNLRVQRLWGRIAQLTNPRNRRKRTLRTGRSRKHRGNPG